MNAAETALFSARMSRESTQAYLVRLTLAFLNAWNDQRYEDILSADFLAPSYRMKRGFGKVEMKGNPAVDLTGLVEHHQNLAKDSPERHAHAVEAHAIMDKHHCSGQVFVNVELTGHPPGVTYAGVIVSDWWVQVPECATCYKHLESLLMVLMISQAVATRKMALCSPDLHARHWNSGTRSSRAETTVTTTHRSRQAIRYLSTPS